MYTKYKVNQSILDHFLYKEIGGISGQWLFFDTVAIETIKHTFDLV